LIGIFNNPIDKLRFTNNRWGLWSPIISSSSRTEQDKDQLTHDFELQDVGLGVTLDVGSDAGVEAGLLAGDALQD